MGKEGLELVHECLKLVPANFWDRESLLYLFLGGPGGRVCATGRDMAAPSSSYRELDGMDRALFPAQDEHGKALEVSATKPVLCQVAEESFHQIEQQ